MLADNDYLIDPELRPLLGALPLTVPLTRETLPQVRVGLANAFRNAPTPDGAAVSVEERKIPGPAGSPQVRVLIYRPAGGQTPMPGFLHIHGGGYVLGVPEIADANNRQRAAKLGCVVVSVDYRLAPDTPHPGPVEDCYAALKWLHDNAASLGVDTTRIAIGGESAGGGLTAGLALLTRDRGEVPLILQYLIYPMIDDRTCTHADPHPYVGQQVWSAEYNAFGWACLLGAEPGSEGISPYAAASRAEDLRGLAPAYISVGALDLFLEEDLEYARRLTRAGVSVELHVYPGAFHGFNMHAGARVSATAEEDGMRALQRAFHG